MGFFQSAGGSDREPRGNEPPGNHDAEDAPGAGQADALARIQSGGIPLSAERRLQALGKDGSLFTSGLSVNESPAPTRAAYQRTTMVLEVGALTNAWATARRNALNRLSEEALQVGADVVVGGELRRGEHDLAKRTIDYLISGTAIRLPGSTKTNWPLLSDFSVQNYWKLHEAGYEPVGLVAATPPVLDLNDR
jgi:hypothetical protein